jgi:hypothetical protein
LKVSLKASSYVSFSVDSIKLESTNSSSAIAVFSLASKNSTVFISGYSSTGAGLGNKVSIFFISKSASDPGLL